MYLCYIDESGTPHIPGNTSHFILAGLSVPIWHWKDCDLQIFDIKKKYALEDAEIHAAWILRKYLEQNRIKDFDSLDYATRRARVEQLRTSELLRLQRSRNLKHYRQTKKNYAQTKEYIHLTYEERQNLVLNLAQCVGGWGFARLFAECIDKIYFDPTRVSYSLDEQPLAQIVSRFEVLKILPSPER